jgi:hypothetical protein
MRVDRIPCLTFLNSAILFWEAALEFGDREQEVVFDFLRTSGERAFGIFRSPKLQTSDHSRSQC